LRKADTKADQAGVRAFVVVRKRRNGRGAKGGRKVDTCRSLAISSARCWEISGKEATSSGYEERERVAASYLWDYDLIFLMVS
jgi:hypothetical protein